MVKKLLTVPRSVKTTSIPIHLLKSKHKGNQFVMKSF